MKTAKIGAIFVVAVMALAGVGASMAYVLDTLELKGTVNTGTYQMSWSTPYCLMGWHEDTSGDNLWDPLCGEPIHWEDGYIWQDNPDKFVWLEQDVWLDNYYVDDITGQPGNKLMEFLFQYVFPNCVIKLNFDFHCIGTMPLDWVRWGFVDAYMDGVELTEDEFNQYFQIYIVDCQDDPDHSTCIELELPIQHDYCIPHYYSIYIFVRQPLEDNGFVDHIFPENAQFTFTLDFEFELAAIIPPTGTP